MPLLEVLTALNEGDVKIPSNFESMKPEDKIDIINQVFKNIGTAWSVQGTLAARNIYPTNLKIPFGSPEMSRSLYQPLIEIFEAR